MSRKHRPLSDYELHMRTLYADYREHCRQTGIVPAPYIMFKAATAKHLTEETVRRQRDMAMQIKPTQDMLYIAMRTHEGDPNVTSVIRQCGQCNHDVWIDADQLDILLISKAIICIECLPEVSGISATQAIGDALSKLYPEQKQ